VICLRDPKTFEKRKTLGGKSIVPSALKTVNGGRYLLVDNRLWDFQQGRQVGVFEGWNEVLSHDAKCVATSLGRRVLVWSVLSGERRWELKTDSGEADFGFVQCLDFSPDGKCLAAGTKGGIRRSNLPNQRRMIPGSAFDSRPATAALAESWSRSTGRN